MPQQRKHPSNAKRQAAYRARQAQARTEELAVLGLPPLPQLRTLPGSARWNSGLRWCVALLTRLRDEMAAYYEQRSEAWQEGDRGTAHQERIEAIEAALDALEAL